MMPLQFERGHFQTVFRQKKMYNPFALPTIVGAIKKAVNMELDTLCRPILHYLFGKSSDFYPNKN
jgi:hypothetical protein